MLDKRNHQYHFEKDTGERDPVEKGMADLLKNADALKKISTTPRLDAELLMSQVINKPRSWIIAHPEHCLTQEQVSDYDQLLRQRLQGKPISYLLGSQEFWSLTFKVTKDTLIPRPETELIVETALGLFTDDEERSFLDLGTGSGAIAIALKHERNNWKGLATDISMAALRVASSNSHLLHCPLTFLCSDWGSSLKPNHDFDLIISNPPYIKADDPHLQSLIDEPQSALVSLDQGLGDLFAVIEDSRNLLKPDGFLILEHGYDQKQAVCDKLEHTGYSDILSLKDLNHQPRACVARYGSS